MRFPFFRNRDSVKNGILISIRRTGDGFHPGLFMSIQFLKNMVLNLLFASIRAVVKVQFVVQIIFLPIETFLLLSVGIL